MLFVYKFIRRRIRCVCFFGFVALFYLRGYYSDYYSAILFSLVNVNTALPFNLTTVRSQSTLQSSFSLANSFDKVSNHGIPFDTKWNIYLDKFDLLNIKNINSNVVLSSTPVIGTAVSSNHFSEILSLLKSLTVVYKDTKMVYIYDLGLTENERSYLLSNYESQIFEIRKFNFTKYPKYFAYLGDFRWKPIVVAELLKEFHSVWWMDSSVRILKPLDHFYNKIRNCKWSENGCQFYPWTLISPTGHSIYAATFPKMYEYMPIPESVAKHLRMWQATIQLIFATKHVRENILRYWVLCALEEECMVPANNTIHCKFNEKDSFTDFLDCHRQDQSAINILLARVNNFVERKYRRETDGVFDIRRLKHT